MSQNPFWDLFLLATGEINSVSNLEFIQIVTTLEIILDQKNTFDCHVCLSQYPNRTGREQLIDARRKSMHCTGEAAKPRFSTSYGPISIGYKRCPGNFYAKWVEHLFSLYNLSPPGGEMNWETAAKNIELMGMIASIKNQIELKELERNAKHGQSRR